MSYIVLARKYRPQSFAEVVGQDPVSKTLLNAIDSGRIAHAYVFSGPRGVGKTTTARILAKCLNCEKGPITTPCNTCPSCESIALGSSVDDVLEIDGASNRGIEQIRELRESAKYTPSSSRYRIYIIDEAHQITKDAFGALLKILEEPPAHVVFMMATTEVQKIPAPILSRCQRFSLRPIAAEVTLQHLKKICAAEKIKADDEALADIVRFVEGSMRDALSLLDQALVFAPTKITSQTLRDLLGLLPHDVVVQFATALRAGDPAVILKKVDQALQDGIDLTQLAKDLQLFYHHVLLAKAGVKDPLKTADKDIEKEAAALDFTTLERNIRLISSALDEMRRSETPRAVFDMYALRIGQKVLDARTLVERLEQLEKTEMKVVGMPALKTTSPLPSGEGAGGGISARQLPSKQSTETSPHPTLSPKGRGNDDIPARWSEVVRIISEQKQTLGMALEEANPVLNNGKLTLTATSGFNQQLINRSLDLITATLAQIFGAAPTIEIILAATPPKPLAQTSRDTPVSGGPAAPVERPIEMEEVNAEHVGDDVKKALKHFPGALKKEKR